MQTELWFTACFSYFHISGIPIEFWHCKADWWRREAISWEGNNSLGNSTKFIIINMLFTREINSKQIEQQVLQMETRVTAWDRNVNLITNCGNIPCCTWQNLSKYFDIVVRASSGCFRAWWPRNVLAKIQNWDANECSCQSSWCCAMLCGGFGFGTTIYDYSMWVAHSAF